MRIFLAGASGAIGSAAVQLTKASGAEVTAVVAAPPLHCGYTLGRLDRADEDGAGASLPLADEIQAPVNAVGAVDVGVTRRAEHYGVALGAAAEAMRGGIGVMIGLDLDDDAARALE